MHKIVYLPLADTDIMSALDYKTFTLDAPTAASDLLDELDKTIHQLAEFPYSCELYRTERPMKDEVRKVTVKNYVLYYAVFQNTVEVRRFLHGRRNRGDGTLFEK